MGFFTRKDKSESTTPQTHALPKFEEKVERETTRLGSLFMGDRVI